MKFFSPRKGIDAVTPPFPQPLRGIHRPGILLRFSFLRFMILAALLLVCIGSTAYANGVDVDGFLQNIEEQREKARSYKALFTQNKTIALFDEKKTSTGVMLYKHPQKMLWKYETPDKTQIRITGESVSFYFPELEQIEIHPSTESASHFFFVFEASAEELTKNFDICVGASADDRTHRIELLPKSEPLAPDLQSITLWVGKSDYLPQKILVREISGDTTEIEFSDIRVNQPVTDEELEFDAPENTEIIEAGADRF